MSKCGKMRQLKVTGVDFTEKFPKSSLIFWFHEKLCHSYILSIGYTHVSGAICEKFHQDPNNNDNCSIQRKKNMAVHVDTLSTNSLLYYLTSWIVVFYMKYDLSTFVLKIWTGVLDTEFWTIFTRFGAFTCGYVSGVYFFPLITNMLTFCLVDPLTLAQFGNWALARFLAFFDACLDFAFWIYDLCKYAILLCKMAIVLCKIAFVLCKIAFYKIKTKVQDFWGLFWHWRTSISIWDLKIYLHYEENTQKSISQLWYHYHHKYSQTHQQRFQNHPKLSPKRVHYQVPTN